LQLGERIVDGVGQRVKEGIIFLSGIKDLPSRGFDWTAKLAGVAVLAVAADKICGAVGRGVLRNGHILSPG